MKTTSTVHWNPGNVAEDHNARKESVCENEPHIDLKNEHGQSFHETLQSSDLRAAYLEIFGDAIAEYNAQQKRKSRQMDVDDYMQTVELDTRGKKQTKRVNGKRVVNENAERQGKQLSYEITTAVGNVLRKKDATGRTIYTPDGHHIHEEELPRELQYEIAKVYCETFQAENPNFRVINMNIHADEGFYNRKDVWEYSVIHPHIEFVPIAHGFKQGLSVQNSMNKAMKEMGFDTPDCYDRWAKKEQKRLEAITLGLYEKYCEQHPDFYAEKGDLEFYHPVSDNSREGGLEKEQHALEQEYAEVIGDARSIQAYYKDGVAHNKAKAQELDAREAVITQRDEQSMELERHAKKRDSEITERDKKSKSTYNKLLVSWQYMTEVENNHDEFRKLMQRAKRLQDEIDDMDFDEAFLKYLEEQNSEFSEQLQQYVKDFKSQLNNSLNIMDIPKLDITEDTVVQDVKQDAEHLKQVNIEHAQMKKQEEALRDELNLGRTVPAKKPANMPRKKPEPEPARQVPEIKPHDTSNVIMDDELYTKHRY